MISKNHSQLWQLATSQLEVRGEAAYRPPELNNREPGGRGSLLIRNWTPPLHSFWAIVGRTQVHPKRRKDVCM